MTFGITTTMGRIMRSCFYCWRSERSGMNYNWITTENVFSFIATVWVQGFSFKQVLLLLCMMLSCTLSRLKRSFHNDRKKEFWGTAIPRVHIFLTLQKLPLPRFFLLNSAPQCVVLQYIALQCNGEEGTVLIVEPFSDTMSTTSACCSDPGRTGEVRSCCACPEV